MRVTTRKLRGRNACEEEVLIFEKEWGIEND